MPARFKAQLRHIRRAGVFLLASITAAALTPMGAAADELRLETSGPNLESTAMWVDGKGPSAPSRDEILLMRKESDVPFVAAAVLIKGMDGANPAELRQLAWDRRSDGACSGGAPRWAVGIQGKSGTPYTMFLGCQEAIHSATDDPGWTHDAFDEDSLQSAIRRVGGSDTTNGKIRALAILFSDGPADGTAYAYLDNVTVNSRRWRASTEPETMSPSVLEKSNN